MKLELPLTANTAPFKYKGDWYEIFMGTVRRIYYESVVTRYVCQEKRLDEEFIKFVINNHVLIERR